MFLPSDSNLCCIDFKAEDTNVEMPTGVPSMQYPQLGKLQLLTINVLCNFVYVH